MKIRPLDDRIVVKAEAQIAKTKGGIVLPDSVKEKPQQGEIIEVGNGFVLDSGKRIPLSVKKGDKILYGKYSGTEIKIDNQEYLIMKENEILAKLEQ